MSDVNEVLNGQLPGILNSIAAAGALGTAAYGLVDASKAFGGGISNAGFVHIRTAIAPLVGGEGREAPHLFGRKDVLATLRANWLNGVAKADQKAAAKSLIRMGVTPENAQRLADETGVDDATLKSVAEKIRKGETLLEAEVTVLGRFDAVVSAVLDEAYERADQKYRNYCKVVALCVATVLAVVGGAVLNAGKEPYWFRHQFWLAALIGFVSTPLAPIAKDLSSALTAAVKAVGVVRR